MMIQGVIALLIIISVAANCQLTTDKTGCINTTTSSCVATCSLYKSQGPCLSVTGCNWTNTFSFMGMTGGSCFLNGGDTCFSQSNASLCGGSCTWQTLPCQFSTACQVSGNGVCTSASNAGACTSQGSQCVWAGQCQQTTVCGIATDVTSCTATSGCFWTAGTSSLGPSGSCSSCFDDPSKTNNEYLTAQSHVGQTCTLSFLVQIRVTVQSVTPSATGCTGGVVGPSSSLLTCGASSLSVVGVISLTLCALLSS